MCYTDREARQRDDAEIARKTERLLHWIAGDEEQGDTGYRGTLWMWFKSIARMVLSQPGSPKVLRLPRCLQEALRLPTQKVTFHHDDGSIRCGEGEGQRTLVIFGFGEGGMIWG